LNAPVCRSGGEERAMFGEETSMTLVFAGGTTRAAYQTAASSGIDGVPMKGVVR
jgi:hypothetical protein